MSQPTPRNSYSTLSTPSSNRSNELCNRRMTHMIIALYGQALYRITRLTTFLECNSSFSKIPLKISLKIKDNLSTIHKDLDFLHRLTKKYINTAQIYIPLSDKVMFGCLQEMEKAGNFCAELQGLQKVLYRDTTGGEGGEGEEGGGKREWVGVCVPMGKLAEEIEDAIAVALMVRQAAVGREGPSEGVDEELSEVLHAFFVLNLAISSE